MTQRNRVIMSGRATRSSYRTVAKTSNVDESLFGNKKPGEGSRGNAQISVVEKDYGKKIVDPKPDPSDFLVLSRSELDRMKKPTSILTPEEVSEIRRVKQAKKDAELAVSNARKEKMVLMEEERKKHVKPTETEELKQAADGATKSRAQFLLDEQLDEVKRMNQMMLYSKCVTIRDAQIEEKKHIKEEAQEEERRLDLMMEVERMKALDAYEEREKKRAEDRKRGAAILMKQIEERAVERQRQEELRDQDRKQMLLEMERMKEEELMQAQEKKIAGRLLLEEVAKANLEQIERKKMIIDAEKEEDVRIAQYIAEKEAREYAQAMEAERIRKEKELETARLRAQQEKAADKQAELDELRALRAQEAYDREWREKERAALARQKAINDDLAQAREKQKLVKMKQLSDQARMEQEEFFRIIDAQQQKEEEDVQLEMQTMAIRKHHKEELLSQISANDERRARERKEYLEEGERLRANMRAEKAKLESIKSMKLDELKGAGIPDKYRSELQRKKIMG